MKVFIQFDEKELTKIVRVIKADNDKTAMIFQNILDTNKELRDLIMKVGAKV
jgi:hypothetical protein